LSAFVSQIDGLYSLVLSNSAMLSIFVQIVRQVVAVLSGKRCITGSILKFCLLAQSSAVTNFCGIIIVMVYKQLYWNVYRWTESSAIGISCP